MNKARLLPFLPVALVAAIVAGCGGGSASLGKNDVAVVGSTHVTQQDFDAEISIAKQSFVSSHQTFPKPGTAQYETIKSQAVGILVQRAERQEKAKDLGVKVDSKQVQARLKTIQQQYFGGSAKRYQAQLKKQHLTDAQVRKDIEAQLIDEALFNKVTSDVKVSNDEIHAYYLQHAQLYTQPETRDARYILVKSKSLASSIYAQLNAGNANTWCTLAKKYSEDPSNKDKCGQGSFSKGQTVKVFDDVLFTQKTNVIHAPVYDPVQYKKWFVIEPTSAVHPRQPQPLNQVKASIMQTLSQQQKNTEMNKWVSGLSKNFCGGSKIRYQVGYQPAAAQDPCAATTTSATTT